MLKKTRKENLRTLKVAKDLDRRKLEAGTHKWVTERLYGQSTARLVRVEKLLTQKT